MNVVGRGESSVCVRWLGALFRAPSNGHAEVGYQIGRVRVHADMRAGEGGCARVSHTTTLGSSVGWAAPEESEPTVVAAAPGGSRVGADSERAILNYGTAEARRGIEACLDMGDQRRRSCI